jgi:hypothetical protein
MTTTAGMASAVGTAIQRWNLRNHLFKILVMLVLSFSLLNFRIQIDDSGRPGCTGSVYAIDHTTHTGYVLCQVGRGSANVKRQRSACEVDKSIRYTHTQVGSCGAIVGGKACQDLFMQRFICDRIQIICYSVSLKCSGQPA